MLLLLLVYHLFQEGANALPITLADTADSIPPSACLDLRHCRQISDIVIGCVTTVFACTWVSLHNDVPPPGSSSWKTLGNRCVFAVVALLFPEVVSGIATRREWAFILSILVLLFSCVAHLVHSFFVQMDGFYLCKNGTPIGPLSADDIAVLVGHGYVLPAAEDIKDKSKGDWVSKGVALLQTCWFLAQCIARRVQHLSITQLEVVTLSYCTMNVVIYAFWWHKPLSVDRPIPVDITRFNSKIQHDFLSRPRNGPTTIWQEIWRGAPNATDGPVDIVGDATVSSPQSLFTPSATSQQGQVLAQEQQRVLGLQVLNDFNAKYGTSFAIGVVFGALHFVAWSYPFPSHTQHVIWRVCCVALVVTPYIGPGFVLETMLSLRKPQYPELRQASLLLVSGILVLVYVFARLATMAISFTTLGSLPPSATDTVQWTRFIPHF
ncbi:hypothetical protein FIBSPDRAFT_829708 [Athelia psychrophila]|uniref:Amino acid transporter transmembrane domain-containing protein n=1 Tax=Athelia psychrophila TaxID=1759441 RepID=A0A166GUY5_9AGAM|nr:hypothetical protein FIBSPDRAFT_829708 [Fibularhizoctonia sp. CBS 109695]